MRPLFLSLLLLAAAAAAAAAAEAAASVLESHQIPVSSGDCPLDFSWSNFTLAASACSNQSEHWKCCRYINTFVAVSIARYSNQTGELGVSQAFSEICLSSISETFKLYGIPPSATVFCGLGPKIRVSYKCEGRGTILEMMQSPNFNDVKQNCQLPLSAESNCWRCLNAVVAYLHHLIIEDDNVTLSICRDAVFIVLANQGGSLSTVDMASCFFGVQGISIPPEPSSQPLTPEASPALVSAQPPTTHQIHMPSQGRQRTFHFTLIPVIGIVVLGSAVVLLLILILLIHKKSKELLSAENPTEASWNIFPPPQDQKCQGPSSMIQRFSYKETKKATENFSTEIGKGGFGTVYRAQFSNGLLAAVKQMNMVSKQGEEEFCREIELLSRLHHRHLVALKGFCVEGNERFLVYEYMENGSLKDHLHSTERNPLRWETRLQIAVAVANALEYLHFYCDPPLCHRDIKSSNILLDDNFVAKVADFGLAHASRSGAIGFEPVNTDVRGTPGYMDPEYVVTQELTDKSDIYSYGVLLLELVTGRRAVQDNRNVVAWSRKFLTTDSRLPELVDPAMPDSFDLEQLQMIAGIIQWCTESEGRARPSIKQVLRIFSERLNPTGDDFERMEHEDQDVQRTGRAMMHRNQVIFHSGDARFLPSSSSTSRSYCSRSVLLESSSPHSPPCVFSP